MSTSKTVRDEAVLLLSALASRQASDAPGSFFLYGDHLEISTHGINLARAAYDAIPHELHQSFELECCEASMLVESGWEDGDDLELIVKPIACRCDPTPSDPDLEEYDSGDFTDDEIDSDSDDALDHADSLDVDSGDEESIE